MIRNGFGRRKSWHNGVTILAFAWAKCVKLTPPPKKILRIVNILAKIQVF